jgi:hypothetical protein
MLVPWYPNESCPYNTPNHLRSPKKRYPRRCQKLPRVSLQASRRRHHPRRRRQIPSRNPLQSPPRILPPNHRRCHSLFPGLATFHFLLLCVPQPRLLISPAFSLPLSVLPTLLSNEPPRFLSQQPFLFEPHLEGMSGFFFSHQSSLFG